MVKCLFTGACARLGVWLLITGVTVFKVQAQRLRSRDASVPVTCSDGYMEVAVTPSEFGGTTITFNIRDQTQQLVDAATLESCKYTVYKKNADLTWVLSVSFDACYIQKGYFYIQDVQVVGSDAAGRVVFGGNVAMKCPLLAVAVPVSGSIASGSCDVPVTEKLSCGESFIRKDDCEAQDCCYDQNSQYPCYYGNKVTVQCTRDGQVVVVVSRNATRPQLSLGSVSMLGGRNPPCNPVRTSSAFTMFKFPVSACGTTMKRNGSDVVYENLMSAFIDVRTGPGGSITRDSTYKLLLQCRYAGNKSVPLQAVVYTIAPPPPVAAQGPLRVELRIAREQSYGSYYTSLDYPVTYVLREPVYVEVRILERTDTNIVLTLDDCWATSTPSPLGKPQWNLLVDGCPYRDDNYLTSLVPVDAATSRLPNPTHYKRFVLKMFAFVNPFSRQALKEMIYIHCSAAVCYPSVMDSCVKRCIAKRHARDAPLQMVRKEASSKQTAVASSGAVILTAPDARALESWDFESEVPQSLGNGLMGVAASVVLVVFVLVPVAVWRLKPWVEETKL
ncbi:zona pellucida sperm-binding protein 4-like [Acipenser ruthenus]|uniref:zona pellucida sperm-binding protein 4-like n=1 Tax=Acipenser ruthenus TaxID=7906 RepID=UPI002741AD10|nr:zona pellucida sperm-binding protein 4-like [Acipenser ruthenus]